MKTKDKTTVSATILFLSVLLPEFFNETATTLPAAENCFTAMISIMKARGGVLMNTTQAKRRILLRGTQVCLQAAHERVGKAGGLGAMPPGRNGG